jgi:O-antigen/teichoic acid export membrane protein
MSLKRNLSANYASQIYVALIGIAVVPLYIQYMGAEAFGLIGIFTLIQSLFNMLDVGLSPTVVRETARLNGGGIDPLTYRRFVRSLEIIFLSVGIFGGLALIIMSEYLATDWLKLQHLPPDLIEGSLMIIALVVSFRWMSVLYRGVITGAEKLVWLSAASSIIATLRFVLVIPVLIAFDGSVVAFFVYQLAVSIIELTILTGYSYRLLPRIHQREQINWQWKVLKDRLGFSLMIAVTSTVWVLVNQTDKLVLSGILSLEDYGYFTLGVLVASSVVIISGPVSTVILPRLTRLEAQKNQNALLSLYRKSTQMVAIIAGASSISIAYCAHTLLLAWTGDPIVAEKTSAVLTLYALGNGFFCISAFPYYLQYAKGDLRLHLYFNIVFVLILVPTIIWATNEYGSMGAGWAWLSMNFLPLLMWLPVVHRKFAPGLNIKWYLYDLLPIIGPMAVCGFLLNQVLPTVQARTEQIMLCLFFGAALMITGAICSSDFRKEFKIVLGK